MIVYSIYRLQKVQYTHYYIFRTQAVVVDLGSCPQTISETFAQNEGSKVYKFAAPSDDVHFNGCDSDFDTVFKIYTEAQYLAGDEDDYEVENDDAFGVCGSGIYASYLNLPYDSSYTGDYYLVIKPYSQASHTDSQLVIAFECGAGDDSDTLGWWGWSWDYWYDIWCSNGWDTYCDSTDTTTDTDTLGYL